MIVLFTFEEEGYMNHIRIERYEMDFYNKKVIERTIIRGKVIITDQGEVDYDFYEKILKYCVEKNAWITNGKEIYKWTKKKILPARIFEKVKDKIDKEKLRQA
jgi:hypothetical protein